MILVRHSTCSVIIYILPPLSLFHHLIFFVAVYFREEVNLPASCVFLCLFHAYSTSYGRSVLPTTTLLQGWMEFIFCVCFLFMLLLLILLKFKLFIIESSFYVVVLLFFFIILHLLYNSSNNFIYNIPPV